jgi:NADPH:quinone reductase
VPKAIRMQRVGGPEVLCLEEYDPGTPGPGEVRVRHDAIGVNYIDVYHRTGLYPVAVLPATPGNEAAGVIEAVGPGVKEFAVGDRVAYVSTLGAYAEVRIIAVDRLIKLPSEISTRQAAAMMLKGMTARYLLHGAFSVKSGHVILVHAAAGGVGQILCQWASHIGATVIGTVGSPEKAALARSLGCHHAILYTEEDFVVRTRAITNGRGVDVVYDSVGQSTFMKSLDCLRPRGMMVSFGQSSGKVPPFEVNVLAAKGSLFLTRPTLAHYTSERDSLLAHAHDLFDMVSSGRVTVDVRHTYPLAEVAQAHRDLEARRTSGSVVLLP